MANPVYIKFTGRLKSTAQEGILAEAQQVQDINLGKSQQEINTDLYSKVNSVGSLVSTAIAGAYKFKKSVASLSEIYALNCAVGDVFNVSNDFTFEGKTYKAGTNVAVKTAFSAGKGAEANLDPLGGITDLSAYSTKDDVNNAFANKFIVLGSKKKTSGILGETLNPFNFNDNTSSDDIAEYFNGNGAPTFDDFYKAIQKGVAVYEKYSVRNSMGGTVLSDTDGLRMLSFISAETTKQYSSTDLSQHTDTQYIYIESGDVRIAIRKGSDGTYSAQKYDSVALQTEKRIEALEKLATLA